MLNPLFYAKLAQSVAPKSAEDAQAKLHAGKAASIQKQIDSLKPAIAAKLGQLEELKNQLATIKQPLPTQPMTTNENLISSGVGALALALGARPQYVQGGLNAYGQVKQDQASRVDLQNLQDYTTKTNDVKTQIQSLADQIGVSQDDLNQLYKQYGIDQGMADEWTKADISRRNKVSDDQTKFQQAVDLANIEAEAKDPIKQYQKLREIGYSHEDATNIAFGDKLRAAGLGQYYAGKNETELNKEGLKSKTSLEVARINAGSRIEVANIGAASRALASEQRAELERQKWSVNSSDQEISDIRKEIFGIDKRISSIGTETKNIRRKQGALDLSTEDGAQKNAQYQSQLADLAQEKRDLVAAKAQFTDNAKKIRANMNSISVAGVDVPIGTKYVWGGQNLQSGVDCSGLVCEIANKAGLNWKDMTAADMYSSFSTVAKNDMQVGDLVFFRTSKTNPNKISHVGIYIGDGKMLQSGSTNGTSIVDLSKYPYSIAGVRRSAQFSKAVQSNSGNPATAKPSPKQAVDPARATGLLK